MNIIYVTGCNSHFFLSTAILLQAFKEQCPGRTLWVCDFGLTEQQRDMLSRSKQLLLKPSSLTDNLHPWIYKSSLHHYIKDLSPDIVVWLDSDSFPVGPFAQEVEKIAETWPSNSGKVAICQGFLGKTWQLASPESNISHFGMNPAHAYYNSGIWILDSTRILQEWAKEVEKVPKNGMFEQDTFNYLLFKNNIEILKLENDYWNVTHDNLRHVTINSEGTVLLKDKEILIVHLTGVYEDLLVSIGPFKQSIRAMINPEMRELQLQLLKKWVVSGTK